MSGQFQRTKYVLIGRGYMGTQARRCFRRGAYLTSLKSVENVDPISTMHMVFGCPFFQHFCSREVTTLLINKKWLINTRYLPRSFGKTGRNLRMEMNVDLFFFFVCVSE